MIEPATSALEACRRYERECTEIARLTREIGHALDDCPTLDPRNPNLMIAMKGEWTHLKALYKAVGWGDSEDPEILSPDEVDEILRGDESLEEGKWEIVNYNGDPPANMACPHCLKAHRAVQARKAARQRFGAAKRYVRRVGKVAASDD